MKHLIVVFLIGLLAGCSSTKSLNGKYDVDKEYKARGTADAIESVDKLPMPKEEFIQKYLEDMKGRQYEAEIEYPFLRKTASYPDTPSKTIVYNLVKVDETHYTATRSDRPEVVFDYTYDPVEKSFTSMTSKLIKR
jgi:hypothetical protein